MYYHYGWWTALLCGNVRLRSLFLPPCVLYLPAGSPTARCSGLAFYATTCAAVRGRQGHGIVWITSFLITLRAGVYAYTDSLTRTWYDLLYALYSLVRYVYALRCGFGMVENVLVPGGRRVAAIATVRDYAGGAAYTLPFAGYHAAGYSCLVR